MVWTVRQRQLATRNGGGYWLVADGGGVFASGMPARYACWLGDEDSMPLAFPPERRPRLVDRTLRCLQFGRRAAWPPRSRAPSVPATTSPTRIRSPRTTTSGTRTLAPEFFRRRYQARTCFRLWQGGDGSPGGPHRTLGSRISLKAERSAASIAILTWRETRAMDSGSSGIGQPPVGESIYAHCDQPRRPSATHLSSPLSPLRVGHLSAGSVTRSFSSGALASWRSEGNARRSRG